MVNPKLVEIAVDGIIYGTMWQDFGTYVRLDVYQNNRRIGYRKLPRLVDQGDRTVKYLIRRMVGNYGIMGRTVSKYKELNNRGAR
jgi:hypothetical protein